MNPKLTEFLKENENITLLGLAWSLWWRLYVAALVVSFGLIMFLAILGAF